MKENFKKAVLLLGMSITIPTVSIAQENIETDISADLVSGYIWRGQDLGNVSIQPTLSVSYKGFSLSAWGSVGFEGKDTKDGVNNEGNRAYASYVSVTAPFKLGGLDWTAEIGATPWANDFYNASEELHCNGSNGFAVSDISLQAGKDVKITRSFSVPVFAKLTWNPRTEGTYFVFGLNF